VAGTRERDQLLRGLLPRASGLLGVPLKGRVPGEETDPVLTKMVIVIREREERLPPGSRREAREGVILRHLVGFSSPRERCLVA
jgi:hypothetical protein